MRNEQKPEGLHRAIIFTIAYFDAFGQPMTSPEIWNYLFRHKATLDEVMSALDELVIKGKIEMSQEFYFLPGKKELVDLRAKRLAISERYWKKAIKSAKILSYCPFIKTIVANNSLALFTCDQESDVDFFIITTKNHLWFARGFSSLVLHLLLLRRYGQRIAGQTCLSMYIAEDKMDLSYIAPREREFFLSYWIAQNAPIFNKEKTFEKYKATNDWTKKDLPNANNNITDYYINFRLSWPSKIVSRSLEIFFTPRFWESIARFVQKPLIKRTQKKFGNPTSVKFDDHILKFHTRDWKRVANTDWDNSLDLSS